MTASDTRRDGGLPILPGRFADLMLNEIGMLRRLYARSRSVCALEEKGRRLYFAFAPEHLQQIFVDTATFHTTLFSVRGPRISSQRRLTSGILQMNEAQHKKHRRLVMQSFTRQAIEGYHEMTQRLAEEMLDQWQVGQTRDMLAEMNQFMLRLTSRLLFGFAEPEIAYRFGRMMDCWVDVNHYVAMTALASRSATMEKYNELLDLANDLEAEIRDMIRRRRSQAGGPPDLLSTLIAAYDAEGGMSDEELIGQVAIIFAAAHMTSANTLTWTLLLAAQHPAVMQRWKQELDDVYTGRPPESHTIENSDLTFRVIRESMRLLPGAAHANRTVSRPTRLGPFDLQRGDVVVTTQFITHRIPEIYEHPARFDPDRWLHVRPGPYEYFPFGAGSRMCLGGPMAIRTFRQVLPMILQRYRLQVAPGAEINGQIHSAMLTPSGPVPMTIHPADGNYASTPVTGNIHSLVDLPEATGMQRAA